MFYLSFAGSLPHNDSFSTQDTAVATLVALYNGTQYSLSNQFVTFTFRGDTPSVVLQGTTDAQVTLSKYPSMCPSGGTHVLDYHYAPAAFLLFHVITFARSLCCP